MIKNLIILWVGILLGFALFMILFGLFDGKD